jgi:hypothetical protein
MGIYRNVYQPFGGTYFEEMAAQAAAQAVRAAQAAQAVQAAQAAAQAAQAVQTAAPGSAVIAADRYEGPIPTEAYPSYQLDWPGIAGTAERLGIAANQIATGAQPLAPGAGVTAPGAAEAPSGIQAPPAGTPGVSAGTSPWLLIGGAALLYFVVLK